FDEMGSFGSSYSTPGWQRAQARKGKGGFSESGAPRAGRGGRGGPDYTPDGVFDQRSDYDDGDDATGTAHLSPGGRGRAEGAGEGDFAQRRAPSPGSLRTPPSPTSGRSRPSSTGFGGEGKRRPPLTIEGELIAKSTGAVSAYAVGDRVFHLKFGNGNVTAVDGNKLTIRFDKAGEKRVVDSFVERV
ncbi:MAG: hypothetical protein ACTHLO_03290, partial [Pseudolabrys sp.]